MSSMESPASRSDKDNNELQLPAKFPLIKGEFLPSEARDLLVNLINSKIQFHQMRSFSHRERFGEVDHASEQRIEQLTQQRRNLQQMLEHAQGVLSIRAEIVMEKTI
ncbi:MAG: hypothetical protein U0T84_12610 [Chitinophagales bacterium]